MTYKFEKASILVVDDMLPMTRLVSNLLTTLGFKTVHTANTSDKGFDLFCRHNPDIVLTDWLMEPFDGIEMTRQIRKDDRSPNKFVPVIMMTGYSHRVRVEQARDVGITEFLMKPFRARDLFARIEQLIERPRQFVETEQFFGPDRRRRRSAGEFGGADRREGDDQAVKDGSSERDAAALLKNLQEQVRQSTAAPPKGRKE